MPRRKNRPVSTSARGVRKGKQTRIRIPQPKYRPIRLRQHRFVEVKDPDPPWFILHRRGVRRLKIGEDPLEMRAVSKETVRGTLPERIVYKRLVTMGQKVNLDFTFQSSLAGGRWELGGIVADFMFPYLHLIIQVQGHTHAQYLRQRKDDEQKFVLSEMGYDVVELDEQLIYSEYEFENAIRRIFGWEANWGTGYSSPYAPDNYLLDVLKRVEVIHANLVQFAQV